MSRRAGTGWAPTGRRRNKYGNLRVVVDGRKFASIREAKRFKELELLRLAGEVRDVRCQVAISCVVEGTKVCTYIADFVYVDCRNNRQVVEDAKGMKTDVYKLKKKLVKACLGIEIQEV